MVTVERLTCIFHEQDPIIAPRRAADDLPVHVKGIVRWYPDAQPQAGYYVPKKYSPSGDFEPLEFINNQWFGLFGHPETSTTHLCTRASAAIPIVNRLGIGYWDITDPEHPDYTPGTIENINVDPPSPPHPSSAITVYVTPPENIPTPQTHYSSPTPGLTIASTSTVTFPTAPSPTTIPTQTAPIQPTIMSASATGGRSGGGGGGGGGTAPATTAAPAPSNGGMRGVQPPIFDGTRAHADDFWAQFRRYKMVNRTHDSMTKAYDRVLTALTYIRGPMINDWVNNQEKNLIARTDTTKPNHVREDDEVLWAEFETAFHDAWTDTSKKQNAYNQLMKLTMAGWDIDTYIATFERLALAAGWALDAKGTIVCFREGLSKGIHSKALDRDKIPRTMDEWKAAARTEVARAKEKYNAGLTNTQRRNQQNRPYNTTHYQPRTSTQTNPNPNIVPMDVDTTTATNFKKLSPPKNAPSWQKKDDVSDAAYRVMWPAIALRTQTIPRRKSGKPPPTNPPIPLQPRNLPKPSKSARWRNPWPKKKELSIWMPEIWDRIFGLPELNGRKYPGISSSHVQYTEELYDNSPYC